MQSKKKYQHLSDNRKKELTDQAIVLIKEGLSNKFIVSQFKETLKGQVSQVQINRIIVEAKGTIKNEHFQEAKTIKALHCKRYDANIKQMLATIELNQEDIISDEALARGEKGISQHQFDESRKRKIKNYDLALNSIRQKEDLIGLVDTDIVVDMSEDVDINVNEEKPVYDITKLSFEKQLLLLELMEEAKEETIQIPSVSEVEWQEQQPVIDVIAEVLPANIEQIAHEIPATIPVEGVTVDPHKKLRENLAKLAAKKLLAAGANLSHDEKKLIED